MISAPAAASPFTSACPSGVLPSVTSTLRCFGSQVNSRNCRSSAMSASSFSGSAAITACPARSSAAFTFARSFTDACRCATTVGPQSSLIRPRRQGRRSRKNRSLLWCSTVCASRTPPGFCIFHIKLMERQLWHASRGGYWTMPHSRHCCSSKRPSAAAAVRPSATRLRAAGGKVGRRVRRTGFLRFGRSKDRCAASESTVVVDHAKPADEAQFRWFHLATLGFAGELAYRLHHPEEAAGRSRLSDRELPARRIQRKAAVPGEAVLAHERRAFAFAAEAEILELHHRDHRVIVVGLDEVHVFGAGAGLAIELVAVERPAGAHLHRIGGKRVMP